MRVLVTNDDGLHAPGLRALAAAAVAAGHDVVAVAPEGDRSGSAAAIGNLGEGSMLPYRPVSFDGLDAVEAFELDAPPALCVIATCLEAFGPRPDFVLSGVNPGHNTGRVTLHSGTVGAALTAAHFGISAVAVSIAGHERTVRHWDVAAGLALDAAGWIASGDELVTLNLSVPDAPHHEVRPPVHAGLAPLGVIRTEVIERTPERLELGFRPTDSELPEGSDSHMAAAGHVVVTPLTGIRVAPLTGTDDLLAVLGKSLSQPPPAPPGGPAR
jgi:5'-nucleotidase